MAVPPIIDAAEFEAVQALSKIRGPALATQPFLAASAFAPLAAWP
ncbi:MAG TPA: hypothetical protein VIE66_05060 [Methylocella sp.]